MEGADKVYSVDYYERNEDQINQEISAVKSQVSFVRKRLECMFYGSVIVTILFLAINGGILGLQLNKDPGYGDGDGVYGPTNIGGNHESEKGNEKLLTGKSLRLIRLYRYFNITICVSVCRGLGAQQPDGRGLWPLLQACPQPHELDRGEERV